MLFRSSKRKCLQLVNEGIVDGWNDPRMVTISGMRRRGYPAEAIRDFINRVGVSKAYSVVDFGLLEACVRENLNENAPRAMAVLRPLKVIIDNYPEDLIEDIELPINQDKPELGTRTIRFSKEIYVEKEDFMIEPPKKYFRLFPGNEVRLSSQKDGTILPGCLLLLPPSLAVPFHVLGVSGMVWLS